MPLTLPTQRLLNVSEQIVTHKVFIIFLKNVGLNVFQKQKIKMRILYCVQITPFNKHFVPGGKMSNSNIFLDAEFKYVSRISLSPTLFALHRITWKHNPTYVSYWGPVGGSLDVLLQAVTCHTRLTKAGDTLSSRHVRWHTRISSCHVISCELLAPGSRGR